MEMKVITTEVLMTILIVAVLAIFATFAIAVGYAQVQTRGITAPGASKVD